MTTEMEMAKNGEFLREYGKQYFIVASEAFDIGRVKWNMVPIGKGGKDGIVFYLTTEQMLSLCTEILNGIFAKKLAADTANYPSAYRFVTGEDGCLHLNIGGGKVGCRIQMQDASSKTNYMMAVSTEAVITMARKYMINSGYTPVNNSAYYGQIVSAFEQGRKNRVKYRKSAPEGLTDVVDTNSVINEAVEEKLKADESQANTCAAPSSTTAATTAAEEDKSEDMILKIHGTKTTKKGFYVFEGVDSNENPISLMFRKEDAEKLNWFTKFENAAATGDTELKIRGEKRDNYILYKGPAKKTSK